MRAISLLQRLSVGEKSRQNAHQHATAEDVSAPEPLDEDLPDTSFWNNVRGRRLLWIIGLLALVLRLLLLPIGHWWDVTIDYNTFIDLARNHSPYDTFTYLSNIARSAGWDTVYEYYAYPPVPLYIYYPLAKLYILLHPHADYFIAVPGTTATPALSIDFFFLLKLPIWIADFLIAALLARMSGTIRGFRDYLLNPYVLLVSGAWTFDAVMVLGLVAGVYAIQRSKYISAGVALAFGTMIKFVPVIAVPTFVIYLIKKQRPLREIITFLAAYGIACLIFIGPFLQGLLTVVGFHGSRVGGGMNWEQIWASWVLFPNANMAPTQVAIGMFGTPTLAIVLLLVYWYIWKTEMSFNRMIIVTALGFFVGSKLINEQYALIILPFLFIEARRLGGVWRWFYRLFWIVPLGFAIMRVPIDRFLFLLYHMVFRARANITAINGMTGFEWTMIPWKHAAQSAEIVLVFALAFFFLSVVVLFWPVRSARIRYLTSSKLDRHEHEETPRRKDVQEHSVLTSTE